MFWKLTSVTVLLVSAVNWFSAMQMRQSTADVMAASRALGRIGPAESRYWTMEECSGRTWHRMAIAPRGKSVTDEKLKHLEGLREIFGLDLSHTGITDAGLASIRDFHSLRFLQLAGTNVTDAGIERLGNLASLRALDLSDTKVTQACAESLRRIRGLELVCAAGTTLTEVPGVRVDTTQAPDSWLRTSWFDVPKQTPSPSLAR